MTNDCWEESKEGRFRALMQVTSGSAERSVTRHVGIMTPCHGGTLLCLRWLHRAGGADRVQVLR